MRSCLKGYIRATFGCALFYINAIICEKKIILVVANLAKKLINTSFLEHYPYFQSSLNDNFSNFSFNIGASDALIDNRISQVLS